MIATVLAMLSEYAWFHFQREERVAAWLGCPGLAVRAAEQRSFARLVDGLRTRYGRGATAAAAAIVHSELLTWLSHHVLLFDVGLSADLTDHTIADRIAKEGAPASLLASASSSGRAAPRRAGREEAAALPL